MPVADIYELPPEAAQAFADAISASKAGNKYASSVYVYPVEDYKAMRLFVIDGGKAGVALKDGHDIVSVFNYDPGFKRGAAQLVQLAVEQGGTTLDAFDTVLPSIYDQVGFVPVARLRWNEEYKPEGWDKEVYRQFNNGEPDVVYMAHDPEFFGRYDRTAGPVVDSPEEAVEKQREFLGPRLNFSRALEADAAEQVKFLIEEAKKLGYESPEALVSKDPAAFMRLAQQWREQHPAVQFSRIHFGTEAFKNWNKGNKLVYENGEPFIAYHGTLSDFEAFDISRVGVWSNLGSAIYATSSPHDASFNYARRDGGDPAFRIERTREEVEDELSNDPDWEYTKEEIDEEVKRRLEISHDGAVIPVFVKMKNPAVLGAHNGAPHSLEETVLTVEDAEEETGTVFDFLGAMRRTAENWGARVGEAVSEIYSRALDDGEITLDKALSIIRRETVYDPDSGEPATGEFIRETLEKMGFDGVVDQRVSKRFPGMFLRDTDSHFILFDPKNVKSALGNSGEFSLTDPRINFSRSLETRNRYENRIDELFDATKGGKRIDRGTLKEIKVLDRGDVLDLIGFGSLPVYVQESHAIDVGNDAHPLTREQWKAVPDWLENPALVVKRTDTGRLNFIAPEKTSNGRLIVLALEPVARELPRQGIAKRHLLLTAYAKTGGVIQLGRRIETGEMVPLYVDQRKGPAFYRESGGQFPGDAVKLRAQNRSLKTERDLVKYRAAFSRRLPIKGDRFTLPADTIARRVQRAIQDNMNRLNVVQQAVKSQGGVLDEASDAYAAHERMSGRAGVRLERFKEKVVRPFTEALGKSGIDINDLATFMYARHAEERNNWIAQINPKMPDGGSGMKTEDARRILADFARDPKYEEYLKLAGMLDDITKQTQRVMVESGLITQSIADAWNRRSKYYVPLRGFEVIDEWGQKGTGTGRGFDLRGAESPRAKGRESRAGQIIENIILMHQRAIVRAEKNRVGKALLNFVLQNKDDALWEVNAHRMVPYFQKNGNVNMWGLLDGEVRYRGEVVKDKDRTIVVKHNGTEYAIVMADKQLLDSLIGKNGAMLEGEQLNIALRAMQGLNRQLSKMWTALNPVFTVSNFARDATFGLFGTAVESGFLRAAQVAKGIFPAMIGIREVERNGTANSEWAKWYEQYKDDGGKFGAYHFGNLEDTQRELMRLVEHARKVGPVKQALRTAIRGGLAAEKLVMDYNAVIENAVRVSAYRRAVEAGQTRAEAASIAKNLTVNFNRKGSLTPVLGAFYIFLNPAVQGTARLAQIAHKHPARFSTMASAMLALGFVLSMMAAGDEDDEGVPRWDTEVPESEKERNMIFMLGDGKRISIPLPYGLGFFYNIGTALADLHRGKKPSKVFGNLWAAMMTHFSPLGGTENLLATMTPTVIDPFVEILTNTNAFGAPLRPEATRMDGTPVAESARYWRGTQGSWQQRVTTWLNEATGGNDVQEGLISISPESIKSLIRYYTGGAGQFVIDSVNTLIEIATVDAGSAVDKGTVPFLKQFYKTRGIQGQQQYFYAARQEALAAAAAAVALKDSDKPEVLARIDQERQIALLAQASNRVNKALGELRAMELEIMTDDALPAREKSAALKEIELERSGLLRKWNATFYNAERSSRGVIY